MVEPLAPTAPITPIVTIRPVEVGQAPRDAVQTQTPLAVLATGTVVQGFVLNRDAQNNPILRTPYGDVQIESQAFLKTGSQVVLQVDNTQNGSARIVTVDGQNLQEYIAQAANRGIKQDTIAPATLPPNAAATQQAQAQQAPIQNNAQLSAMLLSRNPQNATNIPQLSNLVATYIPPNLQKLAAGTPLKISLLEFQSPQPATNEHVASSLPNQPQAMPLPQQNAQAPSTPPQNPANPQIQSNLTNQPPLENATLPAVNPAFANPAQIAENTPLPTNNPPTATNPGANLAVNQPSNPLTDQSPTISQQPALQPPTAPPPQPSLIPPLQNGIPNPASLTPQSPPTLQPNQATQPIVPNTPHAAPNATAATTPQPLPLTTSATNQPAASTNPSANPTTQPPATPIPYGPRFAAAAYQHLAPRDVNLPPASPTNNPVATNPAPSPTVPNAQTPNQAPAPLPNALPTPPTIPTPPTQTNQATTPTNPNALQAAVIGHEQDGANILQSPLGTIKLYTPQPLPMGMVLTLDVKTDAAEIASQQLAASTINQQQLDASKLSIHSDTLSWATELSQNLASADPKTAEAPSLRNLLQRLPTVGPGLTSNILSFIASVKSGDVRQWLDKRTIESLTSDFPRIAAHLTGDVAQAQQLWNHSPLDSWSGLLIPLNYQGEINYAKLYVRDEEREHSDKSIESAGKRFLVEMDYSQLGNLQFDGFVRDVKSKQFDLMIRSLTPMEPALANNLRAIFDNSVQAAGYTGYLGFQHGAQHFVRPQTQLKPLDSGDYLNTILA